jgi:hypothetical protein
LQADNASATFRREETRTTRASNRNAKTPHETNIFIADWIPWTETPGTCSPLRLALAAGLSLCDRAFGVQTKLLGDHSAPAQKPDRHGNLRVVLQNAETGKDGMEVVLGKLGIAGGNQGQHHGARVGHVGRGVEPVFEEEKQAEDEAGGLTLREEVNGQKKRD